MIQLKPVICYCDICALVKFVHSNNSVLTEHSYTFTQTSCTLVYRFFYKICANLPSMQCHTPQQQKPCYEMSSLQQQQTSQSFSCTVSAFSCYFFHLKSQHSNLQPVLKHVPPQYVPTFFIHTVDHTSISLPLSQRLRWSSG
jgi:hypothetical protein